MCANKKGKRSETGNENLGGTGWQHNQARRANVEEGRGRLLHVYCLPWQHASCVVRVQMMRRSSGGIRKRRRKAITDASASWRLEGDRDLDTLSSWCVGSEAGRAIGGRGGRWGSSGLWHEKWAMKRGEAMHGNAPRLVAQIARLGGQTWRGGEDEVKVVGE